jgi:hypothetical protein
MNTEKKTIGWTRSLPAKRMDSSTHSFSTNGIKGLVVIRG